VIWRRLREGAPLGIDASIIYGIEDYTGDLKWKHLRDAKNPYNSRIHKGLPPTPICSPGLKALEAVFNPTQYGYKFYVADTKRPGWHVFTKTHREHNAKVKELIQATRRGKKK